MCENCGVHHGYEPTIEYVDFYENLYRIRRKGIYRRRYYLEKYFIRFNLSHDHKVAFLKYFDKVEEHFKENECNRK